MMKMHPRQVRIVEFSEKIYHAGLRHKGINGSLYEDCFLKEIREEIPELSFYRGQIKTENKLSPQYDIIICCKDTPQPDFIREVNPLVNIVEEKYCLGVIELKKWANPAMIAEGGAIDSAHIQFKALHPTLKYYFVALRFKDSNVNGNVWEGRKGKLNVDGKFCFYGRTKGKEWEEWTDEMIAQHSEYNGEFERLVGTIRELHAANCSCVKFNGS